jgi:ATP-binding cassette subfamily B protein
MIANDPTTLPWNSPPLSLLTPEQQVQFQREVEIRRYSLGEMIWSTDQPGTQILVVSGKVRLVPEDGPSKVLEGGAWLGDSLELPGFWKARTAGREVIVARWNSQLWDTAASPDLERFWALQDDSISPKTQARCSRFRASPLCLELILPLPA